MDFCEKPSRDVSGSFHNFYHCLNGSNVDWKIVFLACFPKNDFDWKFDWKIGNVSSNCNLLSKGIKNVRSEPHDYGLLGIRNGQIERFGGRLFDSFSYD